jgi:hypothetical protein
LWVSREKNTVPRKKDKYGEGAREQKRTRQFQEHTAERGRNIWRDDAIGISHAAALGAVSVFSSRCAVQIQVRGRR